MQVRVCAAYRLALCTCYILIHMITAKEACQTMEGKRERRSSNTTITYLDHTHPDRECALEVVNGMLTTSQSTDLWTRRDCVDFYYWCTPTRRGQMIVMFSIIVQARSVEDDGGSSEQSDRRIDSTTSNLSCRTNSIFRGIGCGNHLFPSLAACANVKPAARLSRQRKCFDL